MTEKAAVKPEEPKRTFRIDAPSGWLMWCGVIITLALALWCISDAVYQSIKAPQWFGSCSI